MEPEIIEKQDWLSIELPCGTYYLPGELVPVDEEGLENLIKLVQSPTKGWGTMILYDSPNKISSGGAIRHPLTI